MKLQKLWYAARPSAMRPRPLPPSLSQVCTRQGGSFSWERSRVRSLAFRRSRCRLIGSPFGLSLLGGEAPRYFAAQAFPEPSQTVQKWGMSFVLSDGPKFCVVGGTELLLPITVRCRASGRAINEGQKNYERRGPTPLCALSARRDVLDVGQTCF